MTVKCFGDLEMTTFRPSQFWRPDQKANASTEIPCLVLIRSLALLQGLEHPCCFHGQQPRSWTLPEERRNSNLHTSKVALLLLTRS